MELDRKDIKRYILIAKAIDADICDYDNYDIEQAFARNQKRITAYSWKQKYLNNALRIAAILLLPDCKRISIYLIWKLFLLPA